MKTRYIPMLLLLITSILLLPSCTGNNKEPITATNDFQHMLGYIPASYLDEYDIWFGNPAYARQVYDAEEIDSVEALMALPEEERRQVSKAFNSYLAPGYQNNFLQIAPLIGWDAFDIDRTIYHETPPPRVFSISEGNFDVSAIGEKLGEQGYEKATYGEHDYFWKNDDMQVDMTGEISRSVLSKLNRIAVTDTLVITAPATDILTGIMDAMSGNTENLGNDESCLALSKEMNDVFYAVLIPRERVMQIGTSQTAGDFELEAAYGWDPLHDWKTAAIGHRDDGTDSYLLLSLYYTDKTEAADDAANLVSRLNSYTFYTWPTGSPNTMRTDFTSAYEIGEPKITHYGEGSVLTIQCKRRPSEEPSMLALPVFIEARDLLFLVPDPTPYLAD